jgi:uncharacterized C2H2 Zn-finger protein
MDSDRQDIGQEPSPPPEYPEQPLDSTRREKTSIEGSNLFKCPQCEKAFTRQANLKRHLKVKEGAVHEYSCTECEKKFSRRRIWKRHLLVCPESRQVQRHSSLPAVTAIRDPFVVSDMQQSSFPPGLPANGLTRMNPNSKASDISSLPKDGTSHDEDDLGQSEFGMNALNTPRGFPVPHTTTVGESQWMGHLSHIGDDSDTAEIPPSSSGANVNKPGFPTVPALYECNNLDTIDQLNLLASRTAEATEPLPLEESSAIADSSKHEGHTTNVAESPVEMDELKRSSIQVREVQRNGLQEALQEFLAFFGDKLIQTAESKGWMGNTLMRGSVKKTKDMFSKLLENYAAEMMFLHCCYDHPLIATDEESKSSQKDSWTFMDDTLELIHHYRANIADYFCYNSILGLEIAASVTESPLEATQKQSILRWYSTAEKSKSSQKGSRHTGNVIHKEIGTTGEGISSNEFDLVKESLVSNEVFHRLASELRSEPYDWESTKDTRCQIVTSEFDLPDDANTETFCVSFEIDWDIRNFMFAQYRSLVPIATVVVLTGSSTNAQATTCGEYVRQNWPLVGPVVLEIIDKSLASESGDYVTVDSGSSLVRQIRNVILTQLYSFDSRRMLSPI